MFVLVSVRWVAQWKSVGVDECIDLNMFLMIYERPIQLHWGAVVLQHFGPWTTVSLQNFSQPVFKVKQTIHKSFFWATGGLRTCLGPSDIGKCQWVHDAMNELDSVDLEPNPTWPFRLSLVMNPASLDALCVLDKPKSVSVLCSAQLCARRVLQVPQECQGSR